MSKTRRKTLTVGINTDFTLLDDESNTNSMIKPSRLTERDVKHVKVNDSSDLHEVYCFGDKIGQGSFGTVISVVDKITEKNWAMKIINKSAVADKLRTLQREILILKMVDHPHIIYLDKVYESAKKIYLILERCYGALSTVYKEKKPFTEPETRKIIRDLASAVAYLHKNDIVHRDLKLENILIAKNPDNEDDELYIKVSDFGLSIVKQGSGYEDMLHDYCGTIMYMAPEIITSHSYSQQCDIWALGIIMFMLLGGHYPFYTGNEQELMAMICKSEPSYTGFAASNEAIHLITKMLVKNPALRITAAEVIIHPWIDGRPMIEESNSPENVLDMMRLWRSEMMLPVGDECDWVSSARTAGSSGNVDLKQKESPLPKITIVSEDSKQEAVVNETARRQSMHLPVKNIRFGRAANENSTSGATRTGRRTSIAVGADDSHARKRGDVPPPNSIPTSSRRSAPHRSEIKSPPLHISTNKACKKIN